MSPRLEPLSRGTLQSAPTVCHSCVWWQAHGGKSVNKKRWIDLAEESWGPWGMIYVDDDKRLLGVMQYGPAFLFPRSQKLPAGPASADAVLVTCAYLIDSASPWVVQSLFLAAAGEARSRGAEALEAFAYRYGEEDDFEERLICHRAIFPHDLLADLGFVTVREAGRVQLARLELGGLDPCAEAKPGLIARLKRFYLPAPLPVPPRP